MKFLNRLRFYCVMVVSLWPTFFGPPTLWLSFVGDLRTSSIFTCIGALGTPSRTGPLARKYLPGFPYSRSLRKLRQKISSIYCTVICNYPSAAQEQPFTVGLFC